MWTICNLKIAHLYTIKKMIVQKICSFCVFIDNQENWWRKIVEATYLICYHGCFINFIFILTWIRKAYFIAIYFNRIPLTWSKIQQNYLYNILWAFKTWAHPSELLTIVPSTKWFNWSFSFIVNSCGTWKMIRSNSSMQLCKMSESKEIRSFLTFIISIWSFLKEFFCSDINSMLIF